VRHGGYIVFFPFPIRRDRSPLPEIA
jgi:hypothetical protein